MTDDMEFAIKWLETGKQPGTYRGIDKRSIYQRRSFWSMDLIHDITEQPDHVNEKQLSMTREEKMILADIFASFSLRERQCYILHVAQKMSMGKSENEFRITKSTVQQYIERARKKVED